MSKQTGQRKSLLTGASGARHAAAAAFAAAPAMASKNRLNNADTNSGDDEPSS